MCTKHKSNINPKVVELIEKIKQRGQATSESCKFLETIKEQGIQFASGNGMTIEELTDFLEETRDKRPEYVMKWH